LRRLPVSRVTGQRRVRDERLTDRGVSRRRGTVGRIRRARDELLGVGRGVVEAALPIGELIERGVEEATGGIEPCRIAGRLVRRGESSPDTAVVGEYTDGFAHRSVSGHATQA